MVAKQKNLLAHIALLGSSLLWGSSFLAMKVAVANMGPLPVVWLRLVLASLVFALWGRALWPHSRDRADYKWIVLMAVCEPGLYFLLEGNAVRFTTSAQAGTVAAILPLLIAAAAWLILKERIRASTWAGFAVALAGVVLLTIGSNASESAPNPLLGNFLELLAMASATGYMITLKKLSARYSPWFLTAMQAVIGAIFFTPLALPQLGQALAGASALALWTTAYLGIFITVGAYGLYNYGMAHLPAAQAAGYINLIPVVAVVLGWIALGESFTPLQWVAAALVLAGVLISQRQTE